MAAVARRLWFRVYPPENEEDLQPLRDNPGTKNMPPSNSQPIAYFYLMFTMNLLKKIVLETNRYAKQVISRHQQHNTLRQSSRLRLWNKHGKLTISELKGFLAVVFNMGVVRKPTIESYWNKKQKSILTPWFSKMFSRNRFQIILRFLHLVDNRITPQRHSDFYNPAAWFMPLVNHANMIFKKHYTPERELSIDESLVGTKARTVMTQYIPSKAHKFGVKLWMLVEASTGYIIHFLPYRGKRFDPVPVGETQGSYIVNTLLRAAGLLNKFYHVFCDNFFTSLCLLESLFTQNTYLTGTLRANRQMPQLLKNANLLENQSLFIRQGHILCCAFRERKNRKIVRTISSASSATHQQGQKPTILKSYSKSMGGVDLNDMMSGIYDDHRKTKSMWKRLMINIFHRMMLNAYILYTKNTDGPRLSRLDFIIDIVNSLSSEHLNTLQNVQVRRAEQNAGNNAQSLVLLENKNQKDCVECSGQGRRKRSRTVCTRCRKGLHGLCMGRHFCEVEN